MYTVYASLTKYRVFKEISQKAVDTVYTVCYYELAKAEKRSHLARQAWAGRGASLLYVPCQLTGRGDCLKRLRAEELMLSNCSAR